MKRQRRGGEKRFTRRSQTSTRNKPSATSATYLRPSVSRRALVGIVVGAVACTLGALLAWQRVHWLGLVAAGIEAFALVMCLHADWTPFLPGAKDNASGAGVILGTAARLAEELMAHIEVALASTGCEEGRRLWKSEKLEFH